MRKILLVIAVVASACATPITRDTPLSDLSTTDGQALCDLANESKPKPSTDAFWRWDCASQAKSAQTCDDVSINQCVAAIPSAGVCDASTFWSTDHGLLPSTCGLTAGEYFGCIKAYYDQFLQFKDANCATDTSVSKIESATQFAACKNVAAECPDLLPNF